MIFLADQISIPAMLLIVGIPVTTLTFHHLLKAPTRLVSAARVNNMLRQQSWVM